MTDSFFVPVPPANEMPASAWFTRQMASIAALDGGGFVVAFQQEPWNTGQPETTNIYFQLYNDDGTVNGSPVRVNTVTADNQSIPSIVSLSTGGFVISWTDHGGADGDAAGVFMQRYDASGTQVGVETRINTTTSGDQGNSDMFRLDGGGYAVVYESFIDNGGGSFTSAIMLQRYTDAGIAVGSETVISSQTSNGSIYLSSPEIVELTGGNLAVSWTYYDYNLNAFAEMALLSSTGTAVSGVIRPEQNADDTFTLPQTRLVELGNGNVLAVWMYSHNTTGANGVGYGEVYGRIYDATGTAVGNEFAIATGVDNRRFDLYASSDGQGGAIVGYVEESDDGLGGRALLAQHISQLGLILGEPMWLNQNQGGQWNRGEVIALANGDLAVVHQDSGSGALSDIWTQIIANGDDARFSGAANTVTLLDTGEQVAGLGGSDNITGGLGNDIIGGGSGMDTIHGGGGNDVIDGGADGDTLNGDAGDDFINGGSGGDQIDGGADNDIIDGGLGDDGIDGGTGNDTIYGGLGSDIIHGGDGDDTIYGFRNLFTDYGPGEPDRDATYVNYLFGDAGIDYMTGGDAADWIYGGADGDVMNGAGGADLMFGDGGGDSMNGGEGGDYMWGGDGADFMHGNAGIDWLRGEADDDFLWGEGDDDVLIGGSGGDRMYGGTGTDTFYGEDDHDWIYGEANGDVAFGQSGNDHIYGGSEGDFLFGGAGADVINGGTENDLLWGDMPGTYDGSIDTFEFDAGWGFDAVYDFELGVDQVRFTSISGLTQFSNLTLIDGGANVTVVFGADAITFYGVTQAELEANQGDFSFV
ncbi:MAG: calcium-binding protein [Nitratireductor sp.]